MNIFDMMKNFKQLQSNLSEINATGRSGSDMVVVTLNGKFEVQELKISPEAMQAHDSEVISGLVKAAFSDAVQKIQQAIQKNIGASEAGNILGNLFGGRTG